MKVLIFLALVSSLLPLNAFAQGSHGGNGGDIRRHRADVALTAFVDALKELHAIPTTCDLSAIQPNADLIKNKLALVQWAVRMRARWIDTNQKSCLVTTFRPADILLSFSYVNCPLPTPKNFYVPTIATPFFKHFFPAQNPAVLLNDLGKIIEAARRLKCIPTPPRPSNAYVAYPPGAFADPTKARSILESGRLLALKILESLEQTFKGGPFLNRTFSPVIENFLRRTEPDLESEVRHSPFVINADTNAESCGVTQLTRQAPIYFSTQKCTDLQSNYDVAWILLHETTHHLSITAEAFADQVATEILRP